MGRHRKNCTRGSTAASGAGRAAGTPVAMATAAPKATAAGTEAAEKAWAGAVRAWAVAVRARGSVVMVGRVALDCNLALQGGTSRVHRIRRRSIQPPPESCCMAHRKSGQHYNVGRRAASVVAPAAAECPEGLEKLLAVVLMVLVVLGGWAEAYPRILRKRGIGRSLWVRWHTPHRAPWRSRHTCNRAVRCLVSAGAAYMRGREGWVGEGRT